MKTLLEDDIIADTRIFRAISTNQLERYLQSQGWKQGAASERVWTKAGAQVLVPHKGESDFYAQEMELAITNLARYEHCSLFALVEGLGGSLQL